MPDQKTIRVNWGVREDTTQKIKAIMELLKYGSDGDVVDYAVDRLHAALFSEPNGVVTVAEAIRANRSADTFSRPSDARISEAIVCGEPGAVGE